MRYLFFFFFLSFFVFSVIWQTVDEWQRALHSGLMAVIILGLAILYELECMTADRAQRPKEKSDDKR